MLTSRNGELGCWQAWSRPGLVACAPGSGACLSRDTPLQGRGNPPRGGGSPPARGKLCCDLPRNTAHSDLSAENTKRPPKTLQVTLNKFFLHLILSRSRYPALATCSWRSVPPTTHHGARRVRSLQHPDHRWSWIHCQSCCNQAGENAAQHQGEDWRVGNLGRSPQMSSTRAGGPQVWGS